MGNRPCVKCGKTTWFWADPELGCNLCVPADEDQANQLGSKVDSPSPGALEQDWVGTGASPVWNGDPLQGLVCLCTHTMATHSPKTRKCIYPGCPCQRYTASEVYVPRREE